MTRRALTLALAALALWPATALAIPPGGPSENRGGAVITLDALVVAPGAAVAYHGTGFNAGEVVSIKVDDGLVLPQTPAGGADVFATVTAGEDGTIAGSVDLAGVRSDYAAELASGKHLLRFLSGAPRSIHADFAVTGGALPVATVGTGARAFIGPAADLPVAYLANHPYDDIPKLVAGSVVPYRLSGFDPGSTVSVKVNDGAVPAPGVPNGVFGTVTIDANGNAAGTIAVPTTTPGTSWLRFLAPGRSVWAPYAVVASDGRDIAITTPAPAPGSVVAFHGTGLLRSPQDYWPADGDGGQTVHVRLDGTGAPLALEAGSGTLDGSLRLPDDIAPGTHALVFYVGFVEQADGPQAVLARTFTVTAGGSQVPPVGATLAAGAVDAGGSLGFAVTGFVRDAGGGQRVSVRLDGATELACVQTDGLGSGSGTVTVPAGTAPGTHTLWFGTGSGCAADEAPARAVEAAFAVNAPPAATPTPTATPARPARISSSSLKVKRRAVSLSLTPGSARATVTITIRTSSKVRLSKQRKRVTLARRARYVLPAGGRTRTVKLALTAEGRRLLRTRSKVKVQVRLTPAKGKAIARTLTLRR